LQPQVLLASNTVFPVQVGMTVQMPPLLNVPPGHAQDDPFQDIPPVQLGIEQLLESENDQPQDTVS
jgi:hypothetical protein